ncbi:NAD(P)-dependent dehydrogenase (short-subunit alcohol dehydrogenase family) [Gracilibacillus halotolerans]|uniref:NAD(P)-dependent dehydrogenase (Short-subunit alcohol dehydrogenase family) n=1 Tax=Gracilibacillus halotolerans TaxID=74386 RepID=A0A841RLX7_9BACI|nr:SDR family NAD(P)-dependent oxidoreductase [Gracilibacillus halotolerans]MBB6512466.1 NAD(P)-dependent dehydrogenase (short-subunit alcohol dehydrogenase family) [Gracilibacillus halotolerans]
MHDLPKDRLQGKTAIITGGSSGIGRATAIAFAQQGAKVCLMDIKEENAEKVQKEIEQLGGEAFVTDVDLANPQRVEKGIQEVEDRWGRLDIVFANGGINGVLAPIEDLTPEEWDSTINTNLKGTFHTVKYAIPLLKKQGGSIVITSSVNGNRVFSNIGMSAYSTSKAGQMAFGKMAALELAKYKIRVNIICPGAINTNIGKNTDKRPELEKVSIPVEFPEGRHPLEDKPGKPEDVAKLVSFLSSDEASHITGTEVFIDGAESLLK